MTWSPRRRHEPVTIGIPLPSGLARAAGQVHLEDSAGNRRPIQSRALDHWSDGSIRWLLVDCLVDADGAAHDLILTVGDEGPGPATPLSVSTTEDGVQIDTGAAHFVFSRGGCFPVGRVELDGAEVLEAAESGLRIEQGGRTFRIVTSDVSIEDAGPLRVALHLRGVTEPAAGPPLEFQARVEAYAFSATLGISVTITNTRRAEHRGGFWPLGDAGSVLLTSATLRLKPASPVRQVTWSVERGDDPAAAQLPIEIHQESSGGTNWNGPVHKNRHGRVSCRFQGYRSRAGETERTGLRASPVMQATTGAGVLTVAVPRFWENFPQAMGVREDRVEIAFLPGDSADAHELQGGEQKTYRAVVVFGADAVSDVPLAWVHDPVLVYPPPEWCCDSGAVPFLQPSDDEREAGRAYEALVNEVLDPDQGLIAKREAMDEFGWRNFGDLPADHESAFQPAGHGLVSHYNNQYDAIAAFAVHFLRTADRRWHALMLDLAAHVRDIDIYHTTEDKAAYNGGLFWHTVHYTDAGLATHRTYPPNGPGGGGPSSEHNYNLGLMLHYFLTGDPASRRAAIGLGEWVVAMDDGARTPFRWLAGGATGLASQSGSSWYHGPGRGAANSILACLVAYRLSGDEVFRAAADGLIRRCVHPSDDVDANQLLDVEQRWFYTVFLQVLGGYLQDKAECGELDGMFSYVRESLLHYARWMVHHERPYLDHPEILEFPTETWAAQDLRKADVFFWAALHAEGAERDLFLERARFFRDYSLRTLAGMPTRRFTRPMVLLLGNGFRLGWIDRPGELAPPAAARPYEPAGEPVRFEPQKPRAIRRFFWGAATAAGLLMTGAALMWWRS